jgi:disulfide bond formation protein DsbB
MQLATSDVVSFLSLLTVIGQVIIVLLIIVLLRRSKLHQWISRHALLLMLIVALTATLGSLYFSEIAGWAPCKDCWLQRIFMYPQVVLLAVALWKKDRGIAPYILALSLIGMVIAADHYSDQVIAAMQPPENAGMEPCDASGISCAKTNIKFTYGYITIPMMALTAFLMNAVGSIFIMRSKK